MAPTIDKMLSLSLGSPGTGSITQLFSNIQSKFERRNAVKRIISTVMGHDFEQVRFMEPTYCSKCDGIITWDRFGDRGQKCKLCKLVSHDRCFDLIRSRCARESGPKPDNQTKETSVRVEPSSHKFETASFWKPTFCQHCGILIKGLYKQGHKCSNNGCGMEVHRDCRGLVSDSCGQRELRTSGHRDQNLQVEVTIQNNSEQQDWSRTKIEDFQLIRVLATGSFGKVYLAKKEFGNQDKYFAIKVVKKIDPVISIDPKSTMTEKRVLQFGRSYPFLTIAHCCFQSRGRLFFVMEYVEGRELLYHLQDARKFTEVQTRFYSAEIILALIYLHKQGIVHRDLKLDNVIVDKHGHCKLLDFGMSKDLYECEDEKTRTFCGTLRYISYEIWKRLDYNYSVDWWCLGVLMFEMLTGDSPFDSDDQDDLYKMIVIDEEPMKYPPFLSNEARSILQGLLTKDPSQRLGCKIMDGQEQEIKEHPFFLPTGRTELVTDWWKNIEAKRIKPPPISDDFDHEIDKLDADTCLTPIDSDQLKHIEQANFKGFSYYSESFNSLPFQI